MGEREQFLLKSRLQGDDNLPPGNEGDGDLAVAELKPALKTATYVQSRIIE